MVDFGKLLQELDERRTPEERAHRNRYKELECEHTYYKGTVAMLKPEPTGLGFDRDVETQIEVTMFRRVDYHSLEVDDRLLISFEPTPSYYFSRRFVSDWFKNEQSYKSDFWIDMGRKYRVKFEDMCELVRACIDIVEQRNLLEFFDKD